jgi:hypothetical protein
LSKTTLEQEVKLLHRLLSTHNKAVIDRFLPAVERVEANLKAMRISQNDRLDQLEAAVSDISEELIALKTRGQPREGHGHVRAR